MKNSFFTTLLFIVGSHFTSVSQCCSAGGGCPIAGGAGMGVLMEKQLELNANYQYVSTNKFLNGDQPDVNFLDNYSSKYGYYRLGYGISKNLTLSLESGYYFDKTQIGLNKRDTISTNGIADFIIFPRYDVLNKTSNNIHSEITVGAGLKIPLGNPNDTLKQIEPFSGMVYYILKPPAIRTTTGSQDFIFYLSLIRNYQNQNFRIFSNALFIKKGWNALGEKTGNYASVGLFAGKSFFTKLGTTLQLKGEWIGQMKVNPDLNAYGFIDYNPLATGSKKLLLVPQVSYAFKSFNVFASAEFPLYQYVNEEQIASQYFFTTGLSYRFMTASKKEVVSGIYYCPMHPDQTSTKPASCPICGMDMELKK